MIESQFTTNIHNKLDPKKVKAWKIIDEYQGGIFDAAYFAEAPINILVQHIPIFIEYKLIKALPKRENTAIIPALSELQKEWLRRAENANLPVYVIIGFHEKGKAAKGTIYHNSGEWLVGLPKRVFVDRLNTYQELADFITKKLIGN